MAARRTNMILGLFRLALVLLLIAVLITQVIIPAVTGGKFFPIFRKDVLKKEVTKAADEIATLHDKVAVQEELVSLRDKKADLENKLDPK
jgi:hypothetical protein